jgi:hypothetical protein
MLIYVTVNEKGMALIFQLNLMSHDIAKKILQLKVNTQERDGR